MKPVILKEHGNHFDEINDYDAEIPAHIAAYLLIKKSEKIVQLLEEHVGTQNLLGIDLGSGTGNYASYLAQRLKASTIIGLDYSFKQVSAAKRKFKHIPFIQGDMHFLQFPDETFDFVYAINSLHHLESQHIQALALEEIHRVIKPGGILIIHEINLLNPLIYAYLKMIFPRIRKIDTGDEIFLNLKFLQSQPKLEIIKVEYFTFTPDFCPPFLLPLFQRLDAILEKTPLAPMGAHMMVAIKKK